MEEGTSNLHALVSSHVEKIWSYYRRLHTTGEMDTLDAAKRSNFELKIIIHVILHSCRILMQLAAHLEFSQLDSEGASLLHLQRNLHQEMAALGARRAQVIDAKSPSSLA
eukprot:Filipodium_phascolosomae@DN5201_c0_g1_i1.p2